MILMMVVMMMMMIAPVTPPPPSSPGGRARDAYCAKLEGSADAGRCNDVTNVESGPSVDTTGCRRQPAIAKSLASVISQTGSEGSKSVRDTACDAASKACSHACSSASHQVKVREGEAASVYSGAAS